MAKAILLEHLGQAGATLQTWRASPQGRAQTDDRQGIWRRVWANIKRRKGEKDHIPFPCRDVGEKTDVAVGKEELRPLALDKMSRIW
jgi:hypothetical protein